MNKAMNALQFAINTEVLHGARDESLPMIIYKEAISELQAHKAKIESLKEYCSSSIGKFKLYSDEFSESDVVFMDILQKLEELDK
jgi:hypothetical protein